MTGYRPTFGGTHRLVLAAIQSDPVSLLQLAFAGFVLPSLLAVPLTLGLSISTDVNALIGPVTAILVGAIINVYCLCAFLLAADSLLRGEPVGALGPLFSKSHQALLPITWLSLKWGVLILPALLLVVPGLYLIVVLHFGLLMVLVEESPPEKLFTVANSLARRCLAPITVLVAVSLAGLVLVLLPASGLAHRLTIGLGNGIAASAIRGMIFPLLGLPLQIYLFVFAVSLYRQSRFSAAPELAPNH